MEKDELDWRLIENWRMAAEELAIRVSAPVELMNAAGRPFLCEVLVHDFGSPEGTLTLSSKTARRVKQALKGLRIGVCVEGARNGRSYVRKHFVDELLDWGWSGKAGSEPSWYADRMPRSGLWPLSTRFPPTLAGSKRPVATISKRCHHSFVN
jgi:hypothetical protein